MIAQKYWELQEYEQRRIQISDQDARQIVNSARGALTVAPDPSPGWWRLTAGSLVGTLHIGPFQILIRPKIRPENIFLMLDAGVPPGAWGNTTFSYNVKPDLLRAVVSLFIRSSESALARGALHSYLAVTERLVAMRGRLNLPATIGRGGLLSPIDCSFDDFTADIAENRYLKAALRRALRIPQLDPQDRHRLHRMVIALEDVQDLHVPASDLDKINNTRLNLHYRPALILARLVLENLSLVDSAGGTSAVTFILNMNDLFQRFMTTRLRAALAGRLNVQSEPRRSLDIRGGIQMEPDLEFRKGAQAVLVGDLKYKIAVDGRGRASDFYQLLAYTTALNLSHGVLIYCGSAQANQPSTARVLHTAKQLHLWAVDLSTSETNIQNEIDQLSDWIAGRVTDGQRLGS